LFADFKAMSVERSRRLAGGTERVRFMRRTAVALFLAGALTCAAGVGTKLHQTTAFSREGQAFCAGAFLLCGLVLLALPPKRALIEAAVLVSIIVLGALMTVSDPVGMGPLFYLWPMVYAAYFFPPRAVIAMFVATTISLGAGLGLNVHEPLKADTFAGVLSSVGLMVALVSVMSRREDRLRAELARMADTDPLTGLLNRRAFHPRFDEMIDVAKKWGRPVSVVIFDIDHFKRYNDRHGHPAGDEALQRLAAVLRSQSRHEDAVARFGGEEFVVALLDADLAAARAYAGRVAATLLEGLGASEARFSTSAGVSSLGAAADGAESLLARADQALYEAKNAGRACTGWWDGELHVEALLALPAAPQASSWPSTALVWEGRDIV
jgi:diguanylate cyclase (GGDEF)-like protein